MIAQAALHKKHKSDGIRPFDVRCDLRPLANLIELAFAGELDRTGNTIVRDMRRLAASGPLLWLLNAGATVFPTLMRGYVWISEGELAGNVTLTRESEGCGLWCVSNVAVHPSLQGRGIAQQLMGAALQEARARGAEWVLLESRPDNEPAQRLYRDLGFAVFDSVDELRLPTHRWPATHAPVDLPLRRRRASDMQGLFELCKAATPEAAQEVRPVRLENYRLDLGRRVQAWIDPFANGRECTEWVLEDRQGIVAWLQATGQFAQAGHRLHLTVHPGRRGTMESQLVDAGLQLLEQYPLRSVMANASSSHPEAQQAYHAAGFETVRLLDQLALDLREHSPGPK
jgi:ribosomal protein S18 acetylase RimI-like enzyme